MLFRRRRRRDPTERAWHSVAQRLGLEPFEDGPRFISDLLDIPSGASVGPVFRLTRAGSADVWVFYYRQQPSPRGRPTPCVTGCLLETPERLSPVSWRASRKIHSVISSLQASATGGEVTIVPEAQEFNDRVTVVSRDPRKVVPLLGPATRRVLERAIERLEPPPVVTVGERSILLSTAAAEVEVDAVELLLSDLLSLYAALESAVAPGGPEGSAPAGS